MFNKCAIVSVVLLAGIIQLSLDGVLANQDTVPNIATCLGDNTDAQRKEEFTVTVNYSRSAEELVSAGRYDFVNTQHITNNNFPVDAQKGEQKEVSMTLYRFSSAMESEGVVIQMDKDGKRPATLWEISAFAELRPDFQRGLIVVALGSFWLDFNEDRNVVLLFGDNDGRGINLEPWATYWPPGQECGFLAVSK